MYLSRVQLKNFRNYSACDVRLDKGVNVIFGDNAQGKTNLIEAIFFSCVGRSPRTSKDKELIKWNEDAAYIKLFAAKDCGNTEIETYLTHTENKRISVNGMPIARIGELMGTISVVFFSPDELKIVKDGPSDRRKFMDIDLSQMSRAYFYDLAKYNRILSQRNKLLKSGAAKEDTLHVWDLQLSECGARIAVARKSFIDKLKPHAKSIHEFLTEGKETLFVEYDGIAGEDIKDVEAILLKDLEAGRERDLRLCYTTAGVHKDDITLKIGTTDIRTYGSQGQQRTAALSLKLAELEIFRSEIGEPPILILDDVLSELDKSRQQKLLEKAQGLQTIITCTHLEVEPGEATCFKVENGIIQKI